MRTMEASAARDQFYHLLSDVNENSVPVTIVNTGGQNAVLISENDWNAIQETLYLSSIPGMVESIIKEEPLDEMTIYDSQEEW